MEFDAAFLQRVIAECRGMEVSFNSIVGPYGTEQRGQLRRRIVRDDARDHRHGTREAALRRKREPAADLRMLEHPLRAALRRHRRTLESSAEQSR